MLAKLSSKSRLKLGSFLFPESAGILKPSNFLKILLSFPSTRKPRPQHREGKEKRKINKWIPLKFNNQPVSNNLQSLYLQIKAKTKKMQNCQSNKSSKTTIPNQIRTTMNNGVQTYTMWIQNSIKGSIKTTKLNQVLIII